MSMNGKEYKLLIKIAGKIDKSLSNSLKKSVKEINSEMDKLDKVFDGIGKAGKAAFDLIVQGATVAASAIGAATAAAIDVGSEFESAFAGVKKTVDATDEEFEQLREGILGLSREIPSTASEIAGVMEIAGQLAIANDSLEDFTKTMINLGVSTNMSAEDAATYFAKFANIVNMQDFDENGVSNWERLGSTVVDLGNNMATTEEDIVTMSFRLAAAGHLAGLTESEIMGLAAAMSSVGIRAEAGGSSMSKLLKRLQVDVETDAEELENFASVANMTVDEFSEAWRTKPVAALSAFIDGLNDTERNGKSAIAILDEMELKEIRLSNMILALAGSEGIMNEAVDLANNAWEENNALTEEAAKRYETVESQAQLVKNGLQELGIQAYDEMRPLIVDALTAVKDALHDLIDSKAIPNFIKKVEKKLPTIKRLFKTTIGEIIDKAKGPATWVLQNGDKVVGIIAGLAGAFAAFKVGKGIFAITEFLLSLGPAGLAIGAIVTGIGMIAGAWAAERAEEEKLANIGLKDHFGDIQLSLKDLQEVAEHLADNDYFRGMREAFEEFEKLDTYTAAMEDAEETLNKLDFKVKIGIELDEEDKASYVKAIDDYVKNAQEYVVQQQYAVNLALNVVLTDQQLEDTNVVNTLNSFYSGQQEELARLGNELRDTVNDAFMDGLLDINEVKEIQELRAQIAAMKEELAASETSATMSLIDQDLKDANYSYESFVNAHSAYSEQVKENAETSAEATKQALAGLDATYKQVAETMTGPAMIRKLEEIDAARSALLKGYSSNNDEAAFDVFTFDVENGIMKPFNEDFVPALQEVKQTTQDLMKDFIDIDKVIEEGHVDEGAWNRALSWIPGQLTQELQKTFDNLDATDKLSMKKVLEELEPQAEETEALMQKWREEGKKIPDEVIQGMFEYKAAKVAAGMADESDLYSLVGESVANEEQFEAFLEIVRSQGLTVPEEIGQAIIDNAGEVEGKVNELYDKTGEYLENTYSQGFDVEADVRVSFNVISSGLDVSAPSVNVTPDSNATGGIIPHKTLSWLAEEGPEAVIPLDGSDNAISLWEQAGKLLGIGNEDNSVATANAGLESVDTSQTMEITYSPQYVFNGEAPSKQDMVDAAAISQKQFDAMMQEWQKKNRRTRFAS